MIEMYSENGIIVVKKQGGVKAPRVKSESLKNRNKKWTPKNITSFYYNDEFGYPLTSAQTTGQIYMIYQSVLAKVHRRIRSNYHKLQGPKESNDNQQQQQSASSI
jgi:hypothetical protein